MGKINLMKFSIGVLICVVPLLSMQLRQELTAKDIVEKADDNMRGKTSQADIAIKIIRPTWHREINMKAWTKGDDFSMILITSPAKERGTVFLKRIKEVWNWIP